MLTPLAHTVLIVMSYYVYRVEHRETCFAFRFFCQKDCSLGANIKQHRWFDVGYCYNTLIGMVINLSAYIILWINEL